MKLHHRYHAHDDRLYRPVSPDALDNPRLAALNLPMLSQLGLAEANIDWQAVIGGDLTTLSDYAITHHNAPLSPIATAYAGHQFGQWAGQLGDGRSLLIAEISSATDSAIHELHLKGAGLTPYSRHGDGRAMIASTVREYLAGIALSGLNIPTSSAIGMVVSDTPILRYQMERAASLLRVSDCHVRLGHIEWVAMYTPDYFSQFINKLTQDYYPQHWHDDGDGRGNVDLIALIHDICKRTGQLIGLWQLAGFVHGVMNTDNLNITGSTLDFGPYQFMEGFRPSAITNHSDHQARYCYQNQPAMAHWNLAKMLRCFAHLSISTDEINDALDVYETAFLDIYHHGLMLKFGLASATDTLSLDDEAVQLCYRFLAILADGKLDYTNSFRALIALIDKCANDENQRAKLSHEYQLLDALIATISQDKALISTWQDWQADYLSTLDTHPTAAEAIAIMQQHNPIYILRNHMAERAIQAALADDFSEIARLADILSNPYQLHPNASLDDIRMASRDEMVPVSCIS